MAGGPVKVLIKQTATLQTASAPVPAYHTIDTLSISAGLSMEAEIHFLFTDVANGKSGKLKYVVVARNVGGTTTLISAAKFSYTDATPAAITTVDASLSTADVQAVVDGGTQNISIQVVAPPTTTVDWMSRAEGMIYKP